MKRENKPCCADGSDINKSAWSHFAVKSYHVDPSLQEKDRAGAGGVANMSSMGPLEPAEPQQEPV